MVRLIATVVLTFFVFFVGVPFVMPVLTTYASEGGGAE